jgi:hypothetical protein
MIVRQAHDVAHRTPRLLHFALPIRPRDGHLTARQVRSTGLGVLLLSAWFLLAGVPGHPWSSLVNAFFGLTDSAPDYNVFSGFGYRF